MKRILLRESKSPFGGMIDGPIPREHLLAVYEHLQSPGTRNAGNLLFAHATHKVLSTLNSEIEIDKYRLTLDENFHEQAGDINSRYDAYVLPLCNSFRLEYKENLERMTHVIRKLRIPCIVSGVGAQLSLAGDFAELDGIKTQVRNFVSAILDRSASIGVRGEITKSYLAYLGFPKDRVDVIGCPSIFYNGLRLNVRKPAAIDRVALNFNITGIRDARILEFTSYFNENPENVTYIPQVRRLMPQVAGGVSPEIMAEVSLDNMMPRILRPEKIMFFCDVSPWIDFMRTQSFAIGTRIHGNIVPLLAGTPAHVIVHDSRTLELARYLGIPHTTIENIKNFDLIRTFHESDYSNMLQEHPARVRAFANFLERNGLDHNLYAPQVLDAFDEKVRSSYMIQRIPRRSSLIRRVIRKSKRFGEKLVRLTTP